MPYSCSISEHWNVDSYPAVVRYLHSSAAIDVNVNIAIRCRRCALQDQSTPRNLGRQFGGHIVTLSEKMAAWIAYIHADVAASRPKISGLDVINEPIVRQFFSRAKALSS